GWQWDYLDEYFAAPFGGLCCAHDVVDVVVRPGEAAPVVTLSPAVGVLDAKVVQGARGEPPKLAARRDGQRFAVTGTNAAGAPEQVLRVPVADAAAFAADVLRSELA